MSYRFSAELNKWVLVVGCCAPAVFIGSDGRLPWILPQSGNLRDANENAGADLALIAHTSRTMTLEERASALDRISQRTQRESVPLGFDPDAYPLS